MIIPQAKLIFVHIPKTGGTTIEHLFWNDIFKLNEKHPRISMLKHVHYFPQQWAHTPLHLYKKRHEFYTFTFVRNPYARLISHYAYKETYLQHGYDSFEKVLKRLRSVRGDSQKNAGDSHFLTQTSFLQGGGLDFIGKFENFERDLKKVCRTNGLCQPNIKATQIFKTNPETKTKALDFVRENLEEITEIYKSDFDFGYEKYNLENILKL